MNVLNLSAKNKEADFNNEQHNNFLIFIENFQNSYHIRINIQVIVSVQFNLKGGGQAMSWKCNDQNMYQHFCEGFGSMCPLLPM